jgi:DNA mismatch endonuclease (patch repair protein)
MTYSPRPEDSQRMRAVQRRDTAPELAVRSMLHRAGYRFRLQQRCLPGSPDIVLPRFQTAVFVHGCFWHGHCCRRGKSPVSNAAYWEAKIAKNRVRDSEACAKLRRLGWNVAVIWECDLQAGFELLRLSLGHGRDGPAKLHATKIAGHAGR